MVAIVTLALAIGVNTTIFSAANGFLLRKPPVRDPDRLMVVSSVDPARTHMHRIALLFRLLISWIGARRKHRSLTWQPLLRRLHDQQRPFAATRPGRARFVELLSRSRHRSCIRARHSSRRNSTRTRPRRNPERRTLARALWRQPERPWPHDQGQWQSLRDHRRDTPHFSAVGPISGGALGATGVLTRRFASVSTKSKVAVGRVTAEVRRRRASGSR